MGFLGRRRIFSFVFAIALAVPLTACQSFSLPNGHLDGSLLQKSASGTHQLPVRIEIAASGSHAESVEVRDLQNQHLLSMTFAASGNGRVSVLIPSMWSVPIELLPVRDGFADASGKVELHLADNQLVFEIEDAQGDPSFVLSAERFPQPTAPPPVMEAPRSYTLDQAVSTVLTQNFDSRIEYEHQLQARKAARAATLRLLPGITLHGALGIEGFVTGDLLAPLDALDQIAPFLLPSRWFEAAETGHLAKSEHFALNIMRADLAVQVQGLSYELKRSREILAFYESALVIAERILKRVEDIQDRSDMGPLATDNLRSIINIMEVDLASFKHLILDHREDLAQALGLQNPDGVEDVSLPDDSVTLEYAKPMDGDALREIVINRSPELAQIDELIAAANDRKKEVYFNFLDPSADRRDGALGFDLPATVTIAKSKIQELLIAREKEQSILIHAMDDAAEDFNGALEQYRLLKDGMEINQRRLANVEKELKPGTNLNTQDIETVFQDYLLSAQKYYTQVEALRDAQSRIDRLLLRGYYQKALEITALP